MSFNVFFKHFQCCEIKRDFMLTTFIYKLFTKRFLNIVWKSTKIRLSKLQSFLIVYTPTLVLDSFWGTIKINLTERASYLFVDYLFVALLLSLQSVCIDMIGFSLMTKQLNIPFKSLLALGTLPRILLFFSDLHIIINELIGFQVQIFLFFSF